MTDLSSGPQARGLRTPLDKSNEIDRNATVAVCSQETLIAPWDFLRLRYPTSKVFLPFLCIYFSHADVSPKSDPKSSRRTNSSAPLTTIGERVPIPELPLRCATHHPLAILVPAQLCRPAIETRSDRRCVLASFTAFPAQWFHPCGTATEFAVDLVMVHLFRSFLNHLINAAMLHWPYR